MVYFYGSYNTVFAHSNKKSLEGKVETFILRLIFGFVHINQRYSEHCHKQEENCMKNMRI